MEAALTRKGKCAFFFFFLHESFVTAVRAQGPSTSSAVFCGSEAARS